MMTLSEKTHIRNYLISKKLPLDVLMEVTDHFEIQVESFQRDEEISFDEAFKLTENVWQKDFRLTKKSFFSFGKVPVIVKEIQRETNKKLLKKSLTIAFALMLLQFLTAKFMMKDYYFMINAVIYVLLGILIVVLIIVYAFSRISKQRTRAEKYFYNQLLNIFLVSILLAILGVFTKLPTNSFKVVYEFLHGSNLFSTEIFIAAVTSIVFKTAVTFYLYFMLQDRSASIRKVKDYENSYS